MQVDNINLKLCQGSFERVMMLLLEVMPSGVVQLGRKSGRG
jgi:hypothetical protein